jgi:choline dehydrogenase-like flavoprotein
VSTDLRTEVLVIGAGPGGATTAAHLAEAGRQVLILEEGPEDPEYCPPFSRDEMERRYRNGGITVAMGATNVNYVEARCIGGGSEINSGLYHRTPAPVLERWADLYGVRELSEDDLMPHFEACEKDVSVSYLPGDAPLASLKLAEGAKALGWSAREIPRWHKFDPAAGSTDPGVRQTMSRTYLPRALDAGAQLVPGIRVAKLQREGAWWRASGTRTFADGSRGDVVVRCETLFVSAGAIQTPALLLANGIGGPSTGKTLHMHPTAKFTAQFGDVINSLDMGVPVHQVKEFSPRFSFGCSISSPPHLALSIVDRPDALRELHETWPHMGVYYSMIGGGVGRVTPLPRFADPLVRYSLGDDDLALLGESMQRLGELLFAAGATVLYPSVAGSAPIRSVDELRNLPQTLPAGRTNLMTIHLFSSCRMGEDPQTSVTDSYGKVRDTEGLYIADASLLGDAPGVNPQGSVMAITRRNALRFLGAA